MPTLIKKWKNIREKLIKSVNENLIHKEVKYYLFSDKNSYETRAPIAFIMDRDRRVGGIKGVGASNAREIFSKMKKEKDQIKYSLVKCATQKLDTCISTA